MTWNDTDDDVVPFVTVAQLLGRAIDFVPLSTVRTAEAVLADTATDAEFAKVFVPVALP